MSGLVIDASAVTEILLHDEHADKLHSLLKNRDEGERWLIPEFCLLECSNAIWKAVRNNRLTREESLSALSCLHRFPLECIESIEYLHETLALALRHGMPVYDSCYLAMAADLGYPLVSLDRRQLRAASAEGLSLINIAAHPL